MINLPESAYSRYRNLILTGAGALILLGVLNAVLALNISRRKLAEAALRGLERDRAIIVVPWRHHGPLILLRRISPRLYHAALRFALKKGIVHRMFGIQP